MPTEFVHLLTRRLALASLLVLTGLFALTGPAAAAADAPLAPIPADDHWQIELVAAAPAIVHPSVVATAPDGRIFVAEDPMDISTPRADVAAGRIRCIHPDGRITLFADGLYAVFGMKFLDGRLYVLHNPKFSAFTVRDGVGVDRVDLIESTNPNPWALDWNDHVPANFALAMDGYFYVAVGDKGLFHCVGTDGRQVDLRGGGIVRWRPDGSGLEIVSTGVRNILDVAITSEDELFTYDNTDEQQWMSRVTHMVDGGSYGYPFDFVPRRPYTLWMMADYGGGAATGALAYTEDALPADYRDNLFLADFGKRQLLRLELAREGGSFRVARRSDLFQRVPDDFRPVGIGCDDSGESLLICDWQHADNKEAVAVGRLWRLRRRGPSPAAPRPAWYLPTAMAQPCAASSAELLAGLAHPARSVRMTAQRRLVDRGRLGEESVAIRGQLASLVDRDEAAALPRMHALWALALIDSDAGVAAARRIIERTDSPSVTRQALRVVGTLHLGGGEAGVARYLSHGDRSLRTAASIALGRQGGSSACPALLAALDESDLFARYASFTALGRIGERHPEAWPALVAALSSEQPRIREGAAFALRERYSPPLVAALAEFARSDRHPPAARRTAIDLLSSLARQTAPWRGEWWAYHPVNLSPPAKTEAWTATAMIEAAVRALLSDSSSAVRAAAAEAAGNHRDQGAAPALRDLVRVERDSEVRRAALRSLGSLRDPGAAELIVGILHDSAAGPELVGAAIAVAGRLDDAALGAALVSFCRRAQDPVLLAAAANELGKFPGGEVVELLTDLAQRAEEPIVQASVSALGRVPDDAGRRSLQDMIERGAAPRRKAALRSLAQRSTTAWTRQLIAWCADPELREEAAAALTQSADPRGLPVYLQLLGEANAALRSAAEAAIRRHADELLPSIEQQAAQLAPPAAAALQRIYAASDRARTGPLFAIRPTAPTRGEYQAYALANSGDAARGRQLFADERGAGCVKCHANLHVRAEKAVLGPDLTTIGAQFPRAALIEHVLFPNLAIREGYQQWLITTSDGRVVSGLARGETAEQFLLIDRDQVRHGIDKIDVEQRVSSPVSLMPEGLEQGLSLADFADLAAFLESCREVPEPVEPGDASDPQRQTRGR